ncbi:MAG: TauD/TfdA family dioxygenase [Proteobacteria bacterium]|nr:TauD/TfdA family dioxygenase [Pseudomonadota bacterium]
MNEFHDAPIHHLSAWYPGDFPGGKEDLVLVLEPAHLAEIEAALRSARARGLAMEEIAKDDFPLPDTAALLGRVRAALEDGPGLVVLRGFPVERFEQADIEAIYWGVSVQLGMPTSQSVMGDRLGHVIDVTDQDPDARAYRARRKLYPHTDFSDFAGLLCLHQGRAGGVNQFISGPTVHNLMRERRPDLLRALYRGTPWHRLGEAKPGEPELTAHRVPVFSCRDGFVSLRYSRTYVGEAIHDLGEAVTEETREALRLFDELCTLPELTLEFSLRPGEAVFMNNFTMLHGRSAFEDSPADSSGETRRRHLLRIWLAVPDGRPVVPELDVFGTGTKGGVPVRGEGHTPSFARRAPVS